MDVTNQWGNNEIHDNDGYQALQSSGNQLKAERCYWAGQHNDFSGNVDNVPYLSSAPNPVGWGQSDSYDPSTRVMSDPEFIEEEALPLTRIVDDGNIVASEKFDTAAWSAQFTEAMKLGFDAEEWSYAALLITRLWRELQDARVPVLDYAALAGYAENSKVDAAIRKYLALTLVEKSLATHDIATALADLEKYRLRNVEHDAELLANVGIINLHFKNDLTAAENVLSQLRSKAAQNDAAAVEQERILAEMIDNYRENVDGVPSTDGNRIAQAPNATTEASLRVDNFPNPFNPETLIRYRISGEAAQEVSLVVYNTLGQKIRTLVAESKNPGDYSVVWDGRDNFGKEAASGMYFLRAVIGGKALTRKLMLLR